MLKTFQPTTSKQNATNNKNNKKTKTVNSNYTTDNNQKYGRKHLGRKYGTIP